MHLAGAREKNHAKCSANFYFNVFISCFNQIDTGSRIMNPNRARIKVFLFLRNSLGESCRQICIKSTEASRNWNVTHFHILTRDRFAKVSGENCSNKRITWGMLHASFCGQNPEWGHTFANIFDGKRRNWLIKWSTQTKVKRTSELQRRRSKHTHIF